VEVRCPASLDTVTVHPDAVHATVISHGASQALTARLLVAADGAQSRVRQQLGIRALQWDYGQTAGIATVTPALPHRNVAYERFTESGPVALLPLREGRCGVVCTESREQANAVLELDDTAFLAFLQDRFGDRLGRFLSTGRRQSYPLYMTKSLEHARPRVAVIGNAAHTLHPIAGQGFNLGLRDVAALAEAVVDAWCHGRDIGDRPVLVRYAAWRRGDQLRTIAFTDGMARLFVNRLPLVRLARTLGLLAFDLFPPAKHLLARQTMGQIGVLPRLARGLPLPGRGGA
jgi:2-octaprenyl-6-methoxyphenol hydroxylase